MRNLIECPPALIKVLSVTTFALLPTIGWGQVPPRNLADLPGLTEVQRPAAIAVQDVCAKFGAQTDFKPVLTSDRLADKLFYSCRQMVQTANAIKDPNTSPPLSLGLDTEQLATLTQAVAPVQMGAAKPAEGLKSTQLLSRLLELRSGARGMGVSLNGVEGNTETLAANKVSSEPSGGGASADLGTDPYGAFFNIAYNGGNVDRTVRQDGYDFRSLQLLAGWDVRLSSTLILGAAISYNDTHSSFEQGLGKVDSQTFGVAGYGTYFVDAWYIDGFLSYGWVDYDTVRNINADPAPGAKGEPIHTSATASPKGDQWTASLGFGRDFAYSGMTIAPSARLTYLEVKNKAFSEDEPVRGLGLAVDSRTVTSFQSSIGARLSTVVNAATGVFGPFVSLNWVHEFKNSNPSITAKYAADPFNASTFVIPTEDPDRDYAIVAVGSSATFPNNWSGFVQIVTALGLRDVTNTGIALGIRKQF